MGLARLKEVGRSQIKKIFNTNQKRIMQTAELIKKESDNLPEAKQSQNYVDLSNFKSVPDFNELEVQDVDLSIEYWTPVNKGEQRKCVFSHIEMRKVEDEETGEEKTLPTAIFYTRNAEGDVITFGNASKRLVGVFENANIEKGFLCMITFLGKEKNATNQYLSDRWKVNPLKLKK